MRDGLGQAEGLWAALAEGCRRCWPTARAALAGHGALVDLLGGGAGGGAAAPGAGRRVRRGGFDEELDETRRLRDQGRGVIAELQGEYVRRTGIGALKIKHNNVLGYFIETPAGACREDDGAAAGRALRPPADDGGASAVHHAGAGRDREEDPQRRGRALEIEKRVFEDLRAAVLAAAGPVGAAARALAEIDVAARSPISRGPSDWVRPEVGEGRGFRITGGRHPVVEQALRRTGGSFVANDCDARRRAARPLWLLTGPNMAGKSTFLRQNALIAVLAQIGLVRAGGGARRSGSSTSCSAGSGPRTTWRAGARPSWSRWSRRRRS